MNHFQTELAERLNRGVPVLAGMPEEMILAIIPSYILDALIMFQEEGRILDLVHEVRTELLTEDHQRKCYVFHYSYTDLNWNMCEGQYCCTLFLGNEGVSKIETLFR